MDALQNLKSLAIKLDANVPQNFIQFVEKFISASKSKKFKIKWTTKTRDVEFKDCSFIQNVIGSDFIPFFIDDQDYYCFNLNHSLNGNGEIVVFATDALVFEWGTHQEYLNWIIE